MRQGYVIKIIAIEIQISDFHVSPTFFSIQWVTNTGGLH